MEETRLLGLISMRRHLFIGVPLVAEMSSGSAAARRGAAGRAGAGSAHQAARGLADAGPHGRHRLADREHRPDAGHGGPAVPLFAQLGTDASGRPWEDYGDNAIDVFDSFRRRACAAARTA
ncbi:hypothetical protein AAH979_32355 [Plantactinospora sp. ZYX-F-223]